MSHEMPEEMPGDPFENAADDIQQYQKEIDAAHEAEFWDDNPEKAKGIYKKLSEKTGNEKLKELFLTKATSISKATENEKKLTAKKKSFERVDGFVVEKCDRDASIIGCPHRKKGIDARCIDCSHYNSKAVTDSNSNRISKQRLPKGRSIGGV